VSGLAVLATPAQRRPDRPERGWTGCGGPPAPAVLVPRQWLVSATLASRMP
jgi:hypothetical protein